MAKILLIPPYQDNSQLPKSVFTVNDRVGFPSGIFRLANFLENNGHNVEVYDRNLKKNTEEKLLEKIKPGNYDIIGSGTLHMTLHNDLDISHKVKNISPNTLFLFGGQEATLAPELMAKYGPADFLVSGEGEIPLVNIANRYDSLRGSSLDKIKLELSDILGVSTIRDGKIIRANKNRCLDEETFIKAVMGIDYNKIALESYWKESGMENINSYTANYCPAGCNFCSSSTFLKSATDNPVKLTSVSADDLFNLYSKISNRKGIKSFYLTDDNALIGYEQREALRKTVQDLESKLNSNNLSNEERNKIIALVRDKEERIYKNMITRMEDFCDLIIKNIVPERRIPMTIQSRLDYIPPELLKKLKLAGVNLIGYGMENFSFTAHKLLNKNINIEKATEQIFETMRAGITPFLNIIHTPPLGSTEDAFYNIHVADKFLQTGTGIGMYPHIIPFAGTYFAKTEPFISDSIKYNLAIGDTGLNLKMPYRVRSYSEDASFYLGLLDRKHFKMLNKHQNTNEDYKNELEYQKDCMDFHLGKTQEEISSMSNQDLYELVLDKVQALKPEDKFNHELEELVSRAENLSLELYDRYCADYKEFKGEDLKNFSSTDASILYMSSFLKAAEEMKIDYKEEFNCKPTSLSIYSRFVNDRFM